MSTYPTAFIPCPYCDAKVQAKILAEKEHGPGEDNEPYQYAFAECTNCHQALVGTREWIQDGGDQGWGPYTREWPHPEVALHSNIPRPVRRSLEEAKRCFLSKSFMACAVMCGRAVEAICREKVGATYLGQGLQKMKAAKMIDDKLLEWGKALTKERNIGAHAGEDVTTRQDANDVMDFAIAISEYVYVLDDKYKAYMQRKAEKTS